jgi:uncharacterized protein
METLAGYLAAGFIGISLGLVGGGGSILTVPVLVYLFHVDPTLATAYSLFIVGTTSLVGGVKSAVKGLVDFRTALVFAMPSFLAVYVTRRYGMPMIPDEILSFESFVVSKDIAIMVLFGIIMIAASISMIRRQPIEDDADHGVTYNYPLILTEGLVVGVLTGLVGAGGGFLIIPALVLFAKLPMKKAIGTSLVIIAAKSLIGFVGDVQSDLEIDFRFITLISAVAVLGIFLGTYVSQFIAATKLRSAFGWFVFVMGAFVIVHEIW